MFEEIVEVVLGPLGLLLLAVTFLPNGRKALRTAAKAVVHAGLTVSETVQEGLSEAKERADDLLQEIKAEGASQSKNHKIKEKEEA